MAEQQQNPGAVTNSFTKGMVKDMNETFVGEGTWTHARNLVNNNHDGQTGVVGNEPATLHCVTLPYDLIGAIHIVDDQWAIFTTDDVNSEIGVFDESKCLYETKVNDPCLGFKRSHLITGSSRKRFDCERPVYFADGLNPDRFIDLDNIPWKYTETVKDGCIFKTIIEPRQLDCEKIRMAPLIKHPCLTLLKGRVAGSLPNGSYQAVIAYTEKGVRFTGYLGISEVQALFTHENVSSSLELTVSDIDTTYDEFELVIIARINGNTVAKKIGNYSTSQGVIYIDRWDQEFETVPLSQVVFRGEVSEKSDALYEVNNYLMKVGDYSKFKFNYQPLANKIKANWVAVEYPSRYYQNGGNNTSYLRDEQYAFFIRWVYNTGDRSESYHIPGRPANSRDLTNVVGGDAFETIGSDPVTRQLWQVENTATLTGMTSSTLADGGRVIATGEMGYWQSTEMYPADRPDIWGSLCGKPILHHKMPDETVSPLLANYNKTNNTIVLLGVQFSNIPFPVDNAGKPIESIVGYEILRGSREGNKTIIAKGMFNNLRQYSLVNENTGVTGLYQNYPYNDLNPDYYLTSDKNIFNEGRFSNDKSSPLSSYRKDMFSFHSPETTFSNPYLNASEVKVYGELSGISKGYFDNPWRHPRNKFLGKDVKIVTDALNIIRLLTLNNDNFPVGSVELTGTPTMPIKLNLVPPKPEKKKTLLGGIVGGIVNVFAPGAGDAVSGVIDTAANALNQVGYQAQMAIVKYMYTETTTAQLQALVYGLIPKRQYAVQYMSHGFYDEFKQSVRGNIRRKVVNSLYVSNTNQSFSSKFVINNQDRAGFVAIQLESELQDIIGTDGAPKDKSRILLSDSGVGLRQSFTKPIASYYGAVKISMPSQYGQLGSIKQLPISTCVTTVSHGTGPFKTEVLFGGDTYINRFTEKNSMCFFNTWLLGEPDESDFDYRSYANLPYPRYWMNTERAEYKLLKSTAKEHHHLDGTDSRFFYINSGYMYLFNSGVRDFYVESEVNLGYRDWEDEISKRHYDEDKFTDISLMFRSDVVKSGNFYKYDYNLSISKLFNSHITWGNMLGSDYNPAVAEQCYVYRPSRVRYSLPQQEESRKDNWRVFLVNNYRDFQGPVTSIKPVNKTGALFMMNRQSPMQFMGVEELKMDGTGAKITIGDGGLFNQPLQSIVNTETSFEYGSCQNKYAVMNTPHGVFWVSQNQGKIFQYTGQINEISRNGLKWWFAKHLPSELLKIYQDYPLFDNPVVGVGVQMIYDNTNEVLYITKRDYKPKRTNLLYDAGGFYEMLEGIKTYRPFTDGQYWEDASWTISYDCKNQMWLSFHDWKPNFLLPSKTHFMSVKGTGVWKHNKRCDLFCNFYGTDYPFDIEFVSSTGQIVNSVRSIEYLLEAYRYYNNCQDKFHVLDENFDTAIIYNSEQVSGLLELVKKDKSNPFAMLTYPQIGTSSIKINFSKEENKYRFNQFWDITKDRGEFSGANVPMFITKPNGYEFEINPAYVNYQKSPLEHKKFRHNVNRVYMRKVKSGDLKLMFKLSNQKLLQSPR